MKRIPVKNLVNWYPNLKNIEEPFMERKAITTDLTKELDGTAVFIASTPDIDREGDIIDPIGIDIKDYNGTVQWNHNLNTLPIGTCVETDINEKMMLAKIKFSDTYAFAKDIAGLCRENILRAVSIGFIPTKVLHAGTSAFDAYAKAKGWVTEGCKRIIASCELIEISLCPVGCNQAALALAAKSMDPESCKTLKIEIEIDQEETNDEINTTDNTETLEQSANQTIPDESDAIIPSVSETGDHESLEETKTEEIQETQESEIEIKPITTVEDNKPVYRWGNLTNENEEELRKIVYGIWEGLGSIGSFDYFWTHGKLEEQKKIKFIDLGTKKSQITNLSEKVFKVYKGLPI